MKLINGRQYEFADITLVMGGRDVIGVRGIKYKENQEKELIYGKGNEPLSIQKGNRAYGGEVVLLQSELETLKLFAKTKTGRSSILGLTLNAVVCYGNPLKGDPMITDKIYGIQFTEEEKGMAQGDKNMEITLPFLALGIDYQS